MSAAPMARAADGALHARAAFAAERDFEALELVEIDVIAAYRRLLADGSPMLKKELIAAALEHVSRQ